jgi:hypothetical protein
MVQGGGSEHAIRKFQAAHVQDTQI